MTTAMKLALSKSYSAFAAASNGGAMLMESAANAVDGTAMPLKTSHITGLCKLRIISTNIIHDSGHGTAQGMTRSLGNPLSTTSGIATYVSNGITSGSSCSTLAEVETHGTLVI